jgi:perosamine synthetase
MTTDQIPIADVSLADDEVDAAVEVLESGYLVQGEQVAEFESSFAEHVGAQHAIAVSSGTAALHLAYLATLDDDDEVLVPAMSHIATASTVSFAGGVPVFCDVDPETCLLDVDSASDQLTSEITAIAPVHLFGNVCDVEAITAFAEENDLTIIWDASQAHGSTYEGADIGGLDDLVTYSFYPTKNMTTAEGGMITTNDDELARECRLLREHWQTEKYYHPSLGLNYRMTDVEAAIGRKQLEKLDGFIAERQANATRLTAGLEQLQEVTTPPVAEHVEHSYHQYTIRVDFDSLSCDRETFRDQLESTGVDTSVHYPRPLHEQPAFDTHVSLPTAERLSTEVLSLPVYPGLETEELDRIIEAVTAAIHDHRD